MGSSGAGPALTDLAQTDLAGVDLAGVDLAHRDMAVADLALGGADRNQDPEANVETGRWTCLQMEVPQNGSGSIRLRVDGVEAADITTSGAGVPPLDHVYLGSTGWEIRPTCRPAKSGSTK